MKLRRITACLVLLAAVCAGCSPAEQERAKATANDAFIEAQVHAKIAAIDAATVSLVNVSVSNRKVTLSGVVHSADERAKVDAATRSVPNVAGVIDRLKVNAKAPTAQEIANDLELQARVKGALTEQTGVNALKVGTTVHSGVVTLDGTYDSNLTHALILQTVRRVPGVVRVVDRMRYQR